MPARQISAVDKPAPKPPRDRNSTTAAEPQEKIKHGNNTQYVEMLLQLGEIPWLHDILASLCTWLLLAGYVVLPGAFTSIRNSHVLSNEAGAAGKAIVKAAQTWPLLLVASICCAVGVSGMVWLWHRWRRNYLWLLNKIIVYLFQDPLQHTNAKLLRPGMLNSFGGLIATITNIYTARNKFWSRAAIVTAVVTGTFACILMILFLFYDFWNLRRVKKEHDRIVKIEGEVEEKEAD